MSVNHAAVLMCADEKKAVRLHLTNVVGLGAVRLLQSLLPSLITHEDFTLEEVYLPARGDLQNLKVFEGNTTITFYKRYLPNAISRLFECTFFGSKFDGLTPLLVFGDIPLRCKTKQTVFVQTPLLMRGAISGRQLGAFKYWVARWLFRHNIRYVSTFIVQTEVMKLSLVESHPEIKERVHVIAQPPPHWLIESQLKRTEFNSSAEVGLRLFYPAACYPHKNHRILSEISQTDSWLVSELILTISEKLNPNPSIPWIRCVDKLEPDAVLNAYRTTDALLFLSLSESFGFPLVEAMWIGLPIICPDLPYARTLCGEQAIYFKPHNVNSLHAAIEELRKRRNFGWWPDWSVNLKKIPRDWQAVADAMLRLATSEEVTN
jgi:glycosyltransferase involved in cell wall biosynthesis